MKELRTVGIFTAGYLLISAFMTFQTQNWEFLYYIAVVVLLGIVAVQVHRRVHLSQGLLWALSIWGVLHMIGGLLPVPSGWSISGTKTVFYSLWIIPNYLKYDHLVHAYGFGCATVLCWQAIRTRLDRKVPSFGVLLLCILGGMGLGAVNEIVEFLAVLLIPDTNVGGYMNTGWDLVSNLVGCTIAAFWIARSMRAGVPTSDLG
jgi:hypothetical protein